MKLIFHSFSVGDVEDVDIYANQILGAWLDTTKGRWVMDHARDLAYYSGFDIASLTTRVEVEGFLEGIALTEYLLRWPNQSVPILV